MWIELDDSLRQINGLSVTQTQTLQTLCNAAFTGRHVLSGSRDILSWLLTQNIGAPAEAVLRRAASQRGSTAGLKQELCFSVRVMSQVERVRCVRGEWQISLAMLAESALGSIEILGEHVRDSELFAIAGEHYRQHRGWGGLRIRSVAGNGGGSAIDATFSRRLSDRLFVVTLVDSDKLYPTAPQSAVSRSCEATWSTAEWPCFFAELPCREVENLIPTNLLENVLTDGRYAALRPALSRLREIWTASPETYLYIDIKSGSRAAHGRKGRAGSDLKVYWEKIIRTVCLGNAFCDECPHDNLNDCNCMVSSHLGERLLESVLEYCRNRSHQDAYKRSINSHNIANWLAIGKIAFDCAIADRPIRA